MLIAILNQSTRMSNADTQTAVAAVAHQVRYHAAVAWHRSPVPVIFYADPAQVPPGAYVISLFDDADQANALGYHTEAPDGSVYGKVFVGPVLDNGGAALVGGLTVASVLSHETLEAFIDPACNMWADLNGQQAYALEVGDPVESDSYTVRCRGAAGALVDVDVSNFVYPEWFDPQAPAGSRFDQLRRVSAPFTMTAGGYVIVEQEGAVTSTFGDALPEWRRQTKQFGAARTARRCRQMATPDPGDDTAVVGTGDQDAPQPETAAGHDPHAPIA